MSNLEIDSAKRENPANNSMELKLLKAKYAVYDNKGRYVRPLFLNIWTSIRDTTIIENIIGFTILRWIMSNLL